MSSNINLFKFAINSNPLSAVLKDHTSTKYKEYQTQDLLEKIFEIAVTFQPAAVNDNIFKMIAEVSGRPITEQQRRCLILACEKIAFLSYTQPPITELENLN